MIYLNSGSQATKQFISCIIFLLGFTLVSSCSLISFLPVVSEDTLDTNSTNSSRNDTEAYKVGDLLITEVAQSTNTNSKGLILEIYNNSDTAINLAAIQLRSYYFDANGVYQKEEKSVSLSEYLESFGYLGTLEIPSANFYSFTFNSNAGFRQEYISEELNIDTVTLGFDSAGGFIEIHQGSSKTLDFMRFGDADSNIKPLSSNFDFFGDSRDLAAPTVVNSISRRLSADGTFELASSTASWEPSDLNIGFPGPSCFYTNTADIDADGIYDCLESGNGDTFGNIDLYAMGARENQKDIFVEIDYLPCDYSGHAATQPIKEALDIVKALYEKSDIFMHFDVGNLFNSSTEISTENYNLGGGNAVSKSNEAVSYYYGVTLAGDLAGDRQKYDSIKYTNFNKARKQLFHYVFFSYSQHINGTAAASGIGELAGNDILISLADTSTDYPCSLLNTSSLLSDEAKRKQNFLINAQSITLAHELGHNLNLMHGGHDSQNYKLNYLSLMNYLYSSGLPRSSGLGNTDVGERYSQYLSQYLKQAEQTCPSSTIPKNGFFSDPSEFVLAFSDGSRGSINENSPFLEKDSSRTWGETIDINCDGYTSCSLSGGKASCPLAYFTNFDATCQLSGTGLASCDIPNFLIQCDASGACIHSPLQGIGIQVCRHQDRSYYLLRSTIACTSTAPLEGRLCDLDNEADASNPLLRNFSCTIVASKLSADNIQPHSLQCSESAGEYSDCKLMKENAVICSSTGAGAGTEITCQHQQNLNPYRSEHGDTRVDVLSDSDDEAGLTPFFYKPPAVFSGIQYLDEGGNRPSKRRNTKQKVFDDHQPVIKNEPSLSFQ